MGWYRLLDLERYVSAVLEHVSREDAEESSAAAEAEYEMLYASVPLQIARGMSMDERDSKDIFDGSLTYGEVPFRILSRVITMLKKNGDISSGDTFIDAGSGGASLSSPLHFCILGNSALE